MVPSICSQSVRPVPSAGSRPRRRIAVSPTRLRPAGLVGLQPVPPLPGGFIDGRPVRRRVGRPQVSSGRPVRRCAGRPRVSPTGRPGRRRAGRHRFYRPGGCGSPTRRRPAGASRARGVHRLDGRPLAHLPGSGWRLAGSSAGWRAAAAAGTGRETRMPRMRQAAGHSQPVNRRAPARRGPAEESRMPQMRQRTGRFHLHTRRIVDAAVIRPPGRLIPRAAAATRPFRRTGGRAATESTARGIRRPEPPTHCRVSETGG
ncbi:hypothetical protein J2S44_003185 [Catenuloplanes niger]|uniref:Uncharacterized protein n=1 Tax=Catenuloplanes niger TaxID=587534 RepID=A0AAE3ZSA0_9ACTN|nr:hypothetical protein [Catenuloplanes niger]